jgi:hypothetical protein
VVGTVRDTSKIADITGRYPDMFIPEVLEMTDHRIHHQYSSPADRRLRAANGPGRLHRHRIRQVSDSVCRGWPLPSRF